VPGFGYRNLLTTGCSLRLVFTHETRVRFPSPAPFIINNLQLSASKVQVN
jgi:hypothetical protein